MTYYMINDEKKKSSTSKIVLMSLQALALFVVVPVLIYKTLQKHRNDL